jgi:hypothetical protein
MYKRRVADRRMQKLQARHKADMHGPGNTPAPICTRRGAGTIN